MNQVSINLGKTIALSSPALSTRMPSGTGSVATQPSAATVETRAVSLSQARSSSGFPVVTPTLPPFNISTPTNVQQIVVRSSQGERVLKVVMIYKETNRRWLVISQLRNELQQIEVTSALREGRIANRPAAFFTQTVPVQGQANTPILVTHAIWEHGDLLIDMYTAGLDEVTFSRIGSSLT